MNVFGNDLSYKERSNSGDSKYDRIGKLEGYVSNLSGNLASIHKKMEKSNDKKLKELEKKLKESWSEDVKKLEAMIKPLLGKDYALKSQTNQTQATVDLFNNKLIDLKKKIEQLDLEITTLKELAQ